MWGKLRPEAGDEFGEGTLIKLLRFLQVADKPGKPCQY